MAGSSELTGSVAIVTGSAKGIGKAIAADLARTGAKVVLADIDGADAAAQELSERGLTVTGATVDVSSEQSCQDVVATACSALGRVDLLVNNAGLFATLTPRPFEQIEVDEWRRVMDVNVMGCFLMAKAVVPVMRANGGGRIVNIGSTSSFKGVPFLLHYTSSKGAVTAFTRSLARELGGDGIRVNAVAPGFTLSDGVLENRDAVERMRANAPGGRVLSREMTPNDVLGAVRFLAGDASGFVTGQTLVVDGGAYLH